VLVRAVVSIRCEYWVIVWIVLELNTLGFLILLSTEKKKEKLIIFFLFQSVASIVLIVFLFGFNSTLELNKNNLIVLLILWSIIVKIGIFPFHRWIIEMSKNISWTNINFVLRWQKIIPIIVLIKSNFKIEIKIILIISLIAIRLIVIKISSIKIIVVLSSIIHNRWILIPLIMIKFLRICYIAVYSAILSIINFFLIKNNIKKN